MDIFNLSIRKFEKNQSLTSGSPECLKRVNLEQENILFGSLTQAVLEFTILLSLPSECSSSSYGVPHPESNRILVLAFKTLVCSVIFLDKELSLSLTYHGYHKREVLRPLILTTYLQNSDHFTR